MVYGAKLGAGGGGFLLFVVPDEKKNNKIEKIFLKKNIYNSKIDKGGTKLYDWRIN